MIILLASAQYTAMITAILSALLGVAAAVFVVVLGAFFARNSADKRRMSEDEYKRELVSNKEIREQKREKKKQDGESKPRHGKKNKNKQ